MLFLFLNVFAFAESLSVPNDYATVQACLNAAVSNVDECVVAPGNYNESVDFLGKAIVLRSSHGAKQTTIDANGLNASVVNCVNGEGPGSVIEGFTITRGRGTIRIVNFTRGGGMFNYGSSPTVRYCTFRDNTAVEGGAVYNFNGSPSFDSCQFIDNRAPGSSGGAIRNEFGNPVIIDSAFVENRAYEGGAVSNRYSNPIFSRCKFIENSATSFHGGAFWSFNSIILIEDCLFLANTAHSGGALDTFGEELWLKNCRFHGNIAEHDGGAIRNTSASMYAENCVFSGCVAKQGGGGAVYNNDSIVTIIHSTFSKNSSDNHGGALANYYDSEVALSNCILWDDSPNEILNFFTVGHPVEFAINYSTVEGDWSGHNLGKDPLFVDSDGMDDIIGTEDDDLRLQSASPCIDAADNLVDIPCIDVAGNLRRREAQGGSDSFGNGPAPRADMGAFEYCANEECEYGDLDGNGWVDLGDYAIAQNCFLNSNENAFPQCCRIVDFDTDADIDREDGIEIILSMTGPE